MEIDSQPDAPLGAPSWEARTQTRGFLFADLRGYTAFADRHGDVAATRLIRRYRAVVRRAVAMHEGAEIRTEGDGFYVVFPSASSAVRCALAIVEEASRGQAQMADEATPAEDPLRVAIGIHAGETADTAEGYVGSAVNTAARIASIAREGEVLVSDTVRSLTRTLLPVSFVSRGSSRLKGLAEPIHVYRVERVRDSDRQRTSQRRRRLSAGVAGVLVVATVAGAAVAALYLVSLFGGATNTGGTPGAIGSPSAAGTLPAATSNAAPPGTATAMNTAELELLLRIPGAIGERCTAEPPRAAGVDARLTCRLPLGAEADTVWYDHYRTRALLEVSIAELERDEGLLPGDCSAGGEASDTWSTPLGTFSGMRLCYAHDDSTWLTWTYDDDLIVATATRGDSAGAALFEWWKGVGPFLRSR